VQARPVRSVSPCIALDLVLTDAAGTLRADLAHDAAAFDTTTAQRWLRQYQRLLEHLVADPDQAITACDVVGDSDRQLVLRDWNRSDRPYPRETRTDELVSLQAQRSPHTVAVRLGADSLTYAELEAGAQGLAQQLTQRGVAAGQCVGLCVQPTPELLVALLAVMKSGATCVVLDPAWSRERLAFVVGDAGLALVLTQGDTAKALPALPDLLLDLDLALREPPPRSESPPAAPATTDHLACLVYTWRSTGHPRGVEVTHRGLTNWLWAMRHEPGCGGNDVVFSMATPSAMGALLEFFLPLIVGARLELATRAEVGQPALLLRRLQTCKPTLMQATPAVWRSLLDAGWSGSRKLVALSAGETLPRELAAHLLDRVAALWNLYGAAHSSGWCLLARVQRGDDRVGIGRPIANARAYIVDEARRPVPIGMPGELCIGGDAVARGVRGKPEAGVAHFIADPFSDDPEARLHATGDLARHRSDGEIELLGRLCAPGTRGIVSLHTPALAVEAACGPRSAPRSTLEFQLLVDWRAALGSDTIGVDGDFFALGGSAPQAQRLLARIGRWSRRGLSLAELFQAPTVAAMARHLASSGWTPPWQAMVALRVGGAAAPMFLVAPVDGDVLQFTGLAQALGDDQPCYGLQLQGLVAPGSPVGSVTAMAARCISEIRSVHAAGPCCIAGVGNGCGPAFEVARQLLAQGVADTLQGQRWTQRLRRAAFAWWQGLRGGQRAPAAGHAAAEAQPLAAAQALLRHDLLRALQKHRPRPASLPLLHVLAAPDPAGANHAAGAVWQALAGVGYQRAEVAFVEDTAWFDAPHDESFARLLAGFACQAPTMASSDTNNPALALAGGFAS
jgi:amino acid adenylation domain-containing protein